MPEKINVCYPYNQLILHLTSDSRDKGLEKYFEAMSGFFTTCKGKKRTGHLRRLVMTKGLSPKKLMVLKGFKGSGFKEGFE
ncbi:hypothetical protein ACFL6B_06985 [Thermodesulfobacteriota bacterium]